MCCSSLLENWEKTELKKHCRSVYIYENAGIFNWKVTLYQALPILQRSRQLFKVKFCRLHNYTEPQQWRLSLCSCRHIARHYLCAITKIVSSLGRAPFTGEYPQQWRVNTLVKVIL
jgi:hypothetical protein